MVLCVGVGFVLVWVCFWLVVTLFCAVLGFDLVWFEFVCLPMGSCAGVFVAGFPLAALVSGFVCLCFVVVVLGAALVLCFGLSFDLVWWFEFGFGCFWFFLCVWFLVGGLTGGLDFVWRVVLRGLLVVGSDTAFCLVCCLVAFCGFVVFG